MDEISSQNSTVVNVANTTIQEAMGFVMIVTAILMVFIFVLTFRLNDKKIRKL